MKGVNHCLVDNQAKTRLKHEQSIFRSHSTATGLSMCSRLLEREPHKIYIVSSEKRDIRDEHTGSRFIPLDSCTGWTDEAFFRARLKSQDVVSNSYLKEGFPDQGSAESEVALRVVYCINRKHHLDR